MDGDVIQQRQIPYLRRRFDLSPYETILSLDLVKEYRRELVCHFTARFDMLDISQYRIKYEHFQGREDSHGQDPGCLHDLS